MIPATVTINGVTHHTRADRGGYIDLEVPDHGLAPGWHQVTIRARASAPVPARVRIVGPDQALGLISDIDDTVMVTYVPRPLIAVWNTFLRHSSARRPVPGMADFSRRLTRRHPDLPVFYLSTGAWNAVPAITEFLHAAGFPPGPKLMTDWGPTNTGWFRSGREHKRRALRRLHRDFPHIRWVLVGDDGQHDPVIYREFADECPGAVAAIAIRELSPSEQVLSHGTPGPGPGGEDDDATRPVPEVRGADGWLLGSRAMAMLTGAAAAGPHASEGTPDREAAPGGQPPATPQANPSAQVAPAAPHPIAKCPTGRSHGGPARIRGHSRSRSGSWRSADRHAEGHPEGVGGGSRTPSDGQLSQRAQPRRGPGEHADDRAGHQ